MKRLLRSKNWFPLAAGCLALTFSAVATEVTLSNEMLQFSWDDRGAVYRIEKSLTLASGSWEEVGSGVSGGTFSVAISDSLAFYRLIRLGLPSGSAPFGCDDDDGSCVGPKFPPWCFGVSPLSEWQEPKAASTEAPLKFDFWQGPYLNKAGYDAVLRINQWFEQGEAAGLGQDAFRSFDSNHSSIRDFYPQLTHLEGVDSYDAECRDVFGPQVTFGVQSLAATASGIGNGLSVIDFHSVAEVLYHYNRTAYRASVSREEPVFTREFYRDFFESNVLLVSPAVESLKISEQGVEDRFFFLSPYYLHSVGKSGSDSRLLKPILFAAASLPRELKTRILRAGMQTPTLTWLFQTALEMTVESESRAAWNFPALALLEEAEEAAPERVLLPDGSQETARDAYERVEPQAAPFLDVMLDLAHRLKHVPPVTRIRHVVAPVIRGGEYSTEPFLKRDPYSVHAVLRPGEVLELDLDLRFSWTDAQYLQSFEVTMLREPSEEGASVIGLEDIEIGRTQIRVPWQEAVSSNRRRTDMILRVNDGTYDSFPAYITVHHLQDEDRELFGF